MPLLRRREFKPIKPPPDLRPDEEVFVCRLTNELFRDFNEFFKRTILCNSLVWSCSLTGKPGLTYQEAVESEAKARRYLASFPVYLEGPILYLVTLTQRGRLADLCDDVFVFARDRYFIGEIVDVSHKGMRETCRVVGVIPPAGGSEFTNGEASDSDDVIIIDDDGQEKVLKMGEPKTSNQTGPPQTPESSEYRYQVMSLQGNGTYEVDYKNIGRKKGLYTREKNKLFLKQHCAIVNHVWCVKREYKAKYKLAEKSFHDFYGGPPPLFVFSPGKRTWKCSTELESSGDEDDDLPLCEVKKKAQAKQVKDAKPEAKAKQKTSPPAEPKKPKLTMEEKEAIRERIRQEKQLIKEQLLKERARAKELLRMQKLEEKEARKEQMRKVMEEDRLKKIREREVMREEKRLQDEHRREFNRMRDDLECDDLKDLPWPSPVNMKLPQELFGDVVVVLEFIYHFKDYLGFSEEFPNGVTLDQIEDALLSNKVDGMYYDLVNSLLSAIFRMQEEEEEDEKVDLKEQQHHAPSADLAEALCDDDPTYTAMTKAATSALVWPQIHQGTLLRQLPVDSTTISEVLRLHFLSSGARTSSENTKWRYQQRGGFIPHDDPGLEFRMQDPDILRTLTTGNMFDLPPASKLKILMSLCGQLLTYVTMRDIIEESLETFQTSRKEWRELVRQEHRREREDAAAKWKRRLEERALEKEHERLRREQRDREREAQLRQDQLASAEAEIINLDSSSETEDMDQASRPAQKNGQKTEDEAELADINARLENLKPLPTQEELDARQKREEEENAALKAEFHKKNREYRLEMAEAATRYSIMPLGEDRIYRRFWLFSAIQGLFVEHDPSHLGDIDLNPVPQRVESKPALPVVGLPEVKQDNVECDKDQDTSTSSNKENIDLEVVNGVMETGPTAQQQERLVKEPLLVNGVIQEAKQEPQEEPDPCMLRRKHSSWAFYSTPQELEDLLAALNRRGFREKALQEAILHEKMRIEESLEVVPTKALNSSEKEDTAEGVEAEKDTKQNGVSRQVVVKMNSGKKGLVSDKANGEEALELLLREQILDVEERVWNGSLGIIKCQQISWGPLYARSFLDDKDFLNMSMPDLPKLEDEGAPAQAKKHSRLAELQRADATGSPSSTRCSTPMNSMDNVVRDLACALLQVSQGIDAKYLKAPLGVEDTGRYAGIRKSKRMQEKLEGKKEESGDEDEDDKKPRKTCRECWEESLMAVTSLSQIFLHLSTLERSIIWAKSILNARCRICRRKGDAEQMLLCDGCDRGLHMYCLKPPLKKVPQGEWYCKDCTPKERSPRKQRRTAMEKKKQEEEEEDEEEEDSSEEESSEEEEEEQASSDEEEEESEEEESEEEESEEEEEEEDMKEEDEDAEGSEEEASDVEMESDDEDIDHLDICGGCGHGGEMVLCRKCPCAYHAECLQPPRHKPPQAKWLCPACSLKRRPNGASGSDAHDDTCTNCGHGGELICCDTCPKAFHMECCKPPLARVPKGQWSCEVCKKASVKQSKNQRSNKTKESLASAARSSNKESRPKGGASSKNSTHKGASPKDATPKVSASKNPPKMASKGGKSQAKMPASGKGKAASAKTPQEAKPSRSQAEGRSSRRQSADSRSSTPDVDAGKLNMMKGVKVVLTAINGGGKRLQRSRSQSLDEGSASEDSGPSSTYRRQSSSGRGSQEMRQLHLCEELLKELVKHPESRPFLSAVSKKAVPDYYKIIKRPMDFASMQTKVNAMEYRTATEFVADVQLIFTNCQQYNQPWSDTYKSGTKLRTFFEKRLKEMGIGVAGGKEGRGKDSPSKKEQPPKKKPRRR
ncbi:bromodomain adjacent to zinc finger domain protein 1A-like [Acanthaster planci]|uniref:Bromodomain adjacent to zinc finger domain protein 1A n=1 Tax=Acanthaster planci TaxID=133434 RepID=A0A8B7YSV4_ACAPL|nr:bromodomain adjacent to zinc finger domain protein 1A-like [Acanthaster planci]